MPSPFDAIDARMQAAIDKVFGEGIRIIPMIGGNYSKAPDPNRAAMDCRATVSRAPASANIDYPSTNAPSSNSALDPVEIWIDRAAYAALGYALRRGDVIVLLDEAGQPKYAATAVYDSGQGDVHVPLVASKRSAE